MKKFLNKLPLFIVLLSAITFLFSPKLSAKEEFYIQRDIMPSINRFENEISDPLGKETFLYDDNLPDKEGQISFGKKGYSKEKYNIVLAESKAIREYIVNANYFEGYSNIDDVNDPLLFPLVKEFKKHLDELIADSVTGMRLDVRCYKEEIKKYGFLFQSDTGNPDNDFYDDPVTLVQMPGTGEQVIKYYVKKADDDLYMEKHNQITSLISSYNDLDFTSVELTNSFNDFVLFYNDFINNKRYTGNLAKFKIKKENATTELSSHVNLINSSPSHYAFKNGEHILKTHFATEDEINNGKIIKVNGVNRKFIPKVFYYVTVKEHDTFTFKKEYINLKEITTIATLDMSIVDNTFYVEWVPETPVVTFKVKSLAENFKDGEILYSTKIVNFSSWEGNIPEIPDYQEFARYFDDNNEKYFLEGWNIGEYFVKTIGWCDKNNSIYDFTTVPTEDLTLYARYVITSPEKTEFSRCYTIDKYYENEIIGDEYICFNINKVTKIAKYYKHYSNNFYEFNDYKDGHNRRYFFEKLVDDEGNEIDLKGFDFNKYEGLLSQKKCKLIYNRYEQFYQVEFNCKEIKNYGSSFFGPFNADYKKYFFKGDIIGEDITREFDKYCQDPQGKMVQKIAYWREKETKERVDLTKPLEERNYVLEPVIEDTTVPFIPIERVVLETNYLSIDPFDTDTYEVKIPYKVYPENATEEFSLVNVQENNGYRLNYELQKLFKDGKIQYRLENKKIVFTFSKEIYEYLTKVYYHGEYDHRDANFGIRFMIIPNSIFFPTNLSSFGYLNLWREYSDETYANLKAINSIYFNFELHSEKLREELKKAKELLESTYFVPNGYHENNLSYGTKIITDELIYNRLFYLIEEADLYLNNIRSTLINPKIQNFYYGNEKHYFGYSHNAILYHLLINLRKTKSEFKSSLKTIDTSGTTSNGFEVVYHNHLGEPFRKFKYVYDINLRLPLVNPELGYHVHKDGDNYVAREFMYWALTRQTIGQGVYPSDIFSREDLLYYYSKKKVLNLYPVYRESFEGFVKINVYDADKNKVFETRVYPKFYPARITTYERFHDHLAYQDIFPYDKIKEVSRIIYYDNWYVKLRSPKYLFSINEFIKILKLRETILSKPISELDFMPISYSDGYKEEKIKEYLEPCKDSQVIFSNYESKLSNGIATFNFGIHYPQQNYKDNIYNLFKTYIGTLLLESSHRYMIREVEFRVSSSYWGVVTHNLYITFRRDNLLKNYPDYINLKFSDIFGKDITGGRPLKIIVNRDTSIPDNPVVYKDQLIFIRDGFQKIFDTVIFANYLTYEAYNYPRQMFLEMKYKKEIIRSIAELNGLIVDTTLNQKTVDRNVFMYMAIYQRILSNILYGRDQHNDIEDIDQTLLNKMKELLEKVQNLKKSVSSISFEESSEIELCLDKMSLKELKELEQKIIESIDYFPFLRTKDPLEFINQKFYDEAKTKIEDLGKNVRVNDKKIKALFWEMKDFDGSYTVTHNASKSYLLKHGIRYLLSKDHESFVKAYNEINELIKKVDKINEDVYYHTVSLPEIKTTYEDDYNTFQTIKRNVVIGKFKNTALMAPLFTFLGIILIGLIVFPIVIKLKKDKKEKK